MAGTPDDKFYERADAHIRLSNEQLKDIDRGKASASMMYATARFNAYVHACACASLEEMNKNREEAIAYFVEQYKQMFEENFDDYAQNFDDYMRRKAD